MKRAEQTSWKRTATTQPFWYVLVVALGAAVFLSVSGLGLPIEVWVLVAAAGLFAIYLSGRSAYSIVFIAIIASIVLNQANYTFFSFASDGTKIQPGVEARIMVLLRLPLVVLAVGLVFARFRSKFGAFLSKNWDVVLFALLPFASALFSYNVVLSLQYAVWFCFSILSVLAFVFLVRRSAPRPQWGEHVAWLLLISSIPAVYLGVTALPSYEIGRYLVSAYNNTNFFAYGCAVALVSLLVLERHRGPAASRFLKKVPTLAFVAIAAASAIPLLLSAKRSPILAVVISLLIYVVAAKGDSLKASASRWMRPLVLTMSIVAMAWVAFPYAKTTADRFEKVFDPAQNTSIQQRQNVIQRGIDVAASGNLIFGLGLSSGVGAAGGGLHNTLLAILVEMGGLGLLLFAVLMGRSLYFWMVGCDSSLRWSIAVLAAPPAMLAFSEYNLLPGQAMFWPIWIAVLLPRLGVPRPPARRQRAEPPAHAARASRVEMYDVAPSNAVS